MFAITDADRGYRWDMRPSSVARYACAVAGRTLTRIEWNAALPGRRYAPSDRHAHDRTGPARQVAHAGARKERLSALHLGARRRPQRRPSIGHSETHLKDRVGHRIRRTSRAVRGRG